MSIIIPDANGKLPEGYREEIRLPVIEIPRHLKQDIDDNPRYEGEFYRAVGKALNLSLNDPRTRLRVITEAALRERVEACYRALEIMRIELKYSLKKCFDILPSRFIESLVKGERLEDVAERTSKRNTWAKEGSTEQVALDPDQMEDLAASPGDDDG